MNSYFRDPVVEEAPRNVILQNRCGSRITIQFFEEQTLLECVYKPNAFRRKDYGARNFSNRDVLTTMFRACSLPQTKVSDLRSVNYDPFITSFDTTTSSLASNRVTILNLPEHNAFALASRSPLLLSLQPHKAFDVGNGLLTEQFEERGEQIVSFVAFDSFIQNRYRMLDNGEHVLQIFENEILLLGAEETRYHALNTITALRGMSLEQLVADTESRIAPALAKGHLVCQDERFAKVLDINRRLVYSGIDAGGACFGALNRIYHLMWVRDGAMTTTLMARSGNADYLKIFAPFLLNNPSRFRHPDGTIVEEFSQIIGTRWSKNEDDGVFYAALTLFTHFAVTGDDSLVSGPQMETVLKAFDAFLAKAWEEECGLIGSDTRGESPLRSNPYFGYDVVCGKIESGDSGEGGLHSDGGRLVRCYSLYNNVNTYNTCMMLITLLAQRPSCDNGRSKRYRSIARTITEKLKSDWVDPQGTLYTEFSRYADGRQVWVPYGKGIDYWEYAWANSLGPFFPVPELQLKSARMVREQWPQIRDYGFCPWNTLSRYLAEYGMDQKAYQAMLEPEINDALTECTKYPMFGALGEYINSVNNPEKLYTSWRALPFTAGSLFYSITAQLVHSLPLGVALRAHGMVDKVENFAYRLSRLNVATRGDGSGVAAVILNGETITSTLQLPQQLLRPGPNTVAVVRGAGSTTPRLYASNAELLACSENGKSIVYQMSSAIPVQLVYENFDKVKSITVVQNGETLAVEAAQIADTGKVLVSSETAGDFVVTVTI